MPVLLFVAALSGCANRAPGTGNERRPAGHRAAREAGAAEFAAEELAHAEALLDGAEEYLELGNSNAYWQAKRNAISAKEVAFEALLASRNAKGCRGGTRALS